MPKNKSCVAVAGIDLGFRKTGIAIIHLLPAADHLVSAITVEPKQVVHQHVLSGDFDAIMEMYQQLRDHLVKHRVEGLFIEFPTGGSKSGRASRCMGMATAIGVFLIRDNNFAFEAYIPSQVEELLGIRAKIDRTGSKKRLNSKDKKDREAACVLAAYPEFEHWPETVRLREDAYDAVGVFLAAAKTGTGGLYHRLRGQLTRGETDV